MSVVLAIGDTHFPFVHPMYLSFCADMAEKHKADWIHHIGDVVDGHAISFHEHDPDGHSSGKELDLACEELDRWRDVFPQMSVSIGNHDERHVRAARKAGLSTRYLKSYSELFETPKWDWQFEHEFENVLYTHGTGSTGKDAAINLAVQRRCPVVQGHTHTYPGVKYHANQSSIIFGLQVGVGLDDKAYAMNYARNMVVKPVLGCGLVIDGESAQFLPMPCSRGQKYHRSRAWSRKR
jgi:predicted phosphodiesterase